MTRECLPAPNRKQNQLLESVTVVVTPEQSFSTLVGVGIAANSFVKL